ncbi:unnamed protein product [Amoebophrya sp. A120]|nr:unnamed protein product [Amoebophrya sp. A120]|eukprot:GSA120T00019558001.1
MRSYKSLPGAWHTARRTTAVVTRTVLFGGAGKMILFGDGQGWSSTVNIFGAAMKIGTTVGKREKTRSKKSLLWNEKEHKQQNKQETEHEHGAGSSPAEGSVGHCNTMEYCYRERQDISPDEPRTSADWEYDECVPIDSAKRETESHPFIMTLQTDPNFTPDVYCEGKELDPFYTVCAPSCNFVDLMAVRNGTNQTAEKQLEYNASKQNDGAGDDGSC